MPLLRGVRQRGTPPDARILAGTFDTGAQAALCANIAQQLGFDLEKGRLDVSVHPFTGGARGSPLRACKLSCSLRGSAASRAHR